MQKLGLLFVAQECGRERKTAPKDENILENLLRNSKKNPRKSSFELQKDLAYAVLFATHVVS